MRWLGGGRVVITLIIIALLVGVAFLSFLFGPGSSDGSKSPTSTLTLGRATIGSVIATDGKSGINSEVHVPVTVHESPSAGRHLWLIAKTHRVGTRPEYYYAKKRVPAEPDTYPFKQVLGGEGADDCKQQVGSVRTFMVVSSNLSADKELEENRRHDQNKPSDAAYNSRRRDLPPGAEIVSNQVDVLRTRC
jgi:hypothetical protein